MTLSNPQIDHYAISIHSALISLLWNLMGLLWAYISSQSAMYTVGIELSAFFFFPAFSVNKVVSSFVGQDITANLLARGDIGSALLLLENLCTVYILAFIIASVVGFLMNGKKE